MKLDPAIVLVVRRIAEEFKSVRTAIASLPSTAGEPGPAGPIGPQGPAGPAGATGPAGPSGGMVVEQLTAAWVDPINKTYWLIARITANATITRISTQTASGTCSVQLTTNAGALGSAVSCSSTLSTSVVSLALVAGDYLKITVSSVSAAVDLCVTIDYQ